MKINSLLLHNKVRIQIVLHKKEVKFVTFLQNEGLHRRIGVFESCENSLLRLGRADLFLSAISGMLLMIPGIALLRNHAQNQEIVMKDCI